MRTALIKLANTSTILNSGGGPTPDKPEVLLETPSDLNGVNSFLNLHVGDIWACYKQWGDKGAFFLTEPLKNPDSWEWRCYMRVRFVEIFLVHSWAEHLRQHERQTKADREVEQRVYSYVAGEPKVRPLLCADSTR